MNPPQDHPHRQRDPSRSDPIAATAHLLRDVDLAFLLRLSALLSWEDATGGDLWSEKSRFEFLHPALTQNLTRAVLESQTSFDQRAQPSTPFLLDPVLNTLSAAQNGPRSTLRVIPTMSVAQLTTDVLAPRLRQQWSLDGRRIHNSLSRTYALLEHYPTLHARHFERRMQRNYVHPGLAFRTRFGLSVSGLLLAGTAIHHRYARRFNEHPAFNPAWLQTARGPQGTPALSRYLEGARPALHDLDIPKSDLWQFLRTLMPPQQADPVLDIMTTTVADLRERLHRPPYNTGVKAFAPLPLERWPLVTVPGARADEHLIIPNSRSMLKGLPTIPLSLLLEDAPQRGAIQEAMGLALEAYVEDLTSDRLAGSPTQLFPKFAYTTAAGQHWNGADLTLIAPGKPVILVEVKARRMPEKTQAEEGTQYFAGMDRLLTNTIEKSLRKYAHLETLTSRRELAAALATAQPSGLVVVVYGEEVALFSSVWRTLLEKRDHRLHPVLGQFLALSIQKYEDHLEHAFDSGRAIQDVLLGSARSLAAHHGAGSVKSGIQGNAWPTKPFLERFEAQMLTDMERERDIGRSKASLSPQDD